MEKITIDETLIQNQAKQIIGRRLTNNECKKVWEAIYSDCQTLSEFLMQKIDDVIGCN
jgi:hypothetical protein